MAKGVCAETKGDYLWDSRQEFHFHQMGAPTLGSEWADPALGPAALRLPGKRQTLTGFISLLLMSTCPDSGFGRTFQSLPFFDIQRTKLWVCRGTAVAFD